MCLGWLYCCMTQVQPNFICKTDDVTLTLGCLGLQKNSWSTQCKVPRSCTCRKIPDFLPSTKVLYSRYEMVLVICFFDLSHVWCGALWFNILTMAFYVHKTLMQKRCHFLGRTFTKISDAYLTDSPFMHQTLDPLWSVSCDKLLLFFFFLTYLDLCFYKCFLLWLADLGEF